MTDKQQFDLFTRSRREDPWTSEAAAARVMPDLNEKQFKVETVLRAAGPIGLTLWEVEEQCGGHHSTWRTRVSELVELGRAANSGRTRRIPSSTDPRAERVVWVHCEHAQQNSFLGGCSCGAPGLYYANGHWFCEQHRR